MPRPAVSGTIAGPDVFRRDELGKITLAAHHDDRAVVTDGTAGTFAAVRGDALVGRADAPLRGPATGSGAMREAGSRAATSARRAL